MPSGSIIVTKPGPARLTFIGDQSRAAAHQPLDLLIARTDELGRISARVHITAHLIKIYDRGQELSGGSGSVNKSPARRSHVSIERLVDRYVVYQETGPMPVEVWSCRTLEELYGWLDGQGLSVADFVEVS